MAKNVRVRGTLRQGEPEGRGTPEPEPSRLVWPFHTGTVK
jgi:hypothetical protein